MKKLFYIVAVFLATSAQAAWRGGFDLTPVVSPLAIRELNDGQWLYGVTKENLWHLDRDGIQRLHVGLFQAWNAESGNASFGTLAGVDIPLGLSEGLGRIGEYLGLPKLFKPAQYLASVASLDILGGYRPVHTSDVNGNWVYGLAARLKVAFGAKELEKGL